MSLKYKQKYFFEEDIIDSNYSSLNSFNESMILLSKIENNQQTKSSNGIPSGLILMVRYKIDYNKIKYWLYIDYEKRELQLTQYITNNAINKNLSKEIFKKIFNNDNQFLSKFDEGKNKITKLNINNQLLTKIMNFLKNDDQLGKIDQNQKTENTQNPQNTQNISSSAVKTEKTQSNQLKNNVPNKNVTTTSDSFEIKKSKKLNVILENYLKEIK